MPQLLKRLGSGCAVLLFLFGGSVTVRAEERIVQTAPQGGVAAGQSVVFRIRIQEIVTPAEANFLFRPIGTAEFKTLPMEKVSEIEFSVVLEGGQLLPPGVEFFYAVKDGRGRLFTSPRLDPRQNPFRIEVSLTAPIPGGLVFPRMDGARTKNLRPPLVIPLSPTEGSGNLGSWRLLVDDLDVSSLAAAGEEGIVYTPPQDLGYGKHTVVLEAMDAAGNMLPARRWSFFVPQSELFDKASVQILADAQTDLRLAGKRGTSEPGWKVQSNATLASVIEAGEFKVALNANGWFNEQENDPENEDDFFLNQFLLEISYRKQRLAFGDLTVPGTELIGETISRRGALLELHFGGATAHAFLLRSDTTTEFDDAAELGDPGRRLIGVSLEQRWEGFMNAALKVSAISGRIDSPDDYNTGSMAAPSKGQLYTLRFAASPFAEKLNLVGEYGLSRFDEDADDSDGYERGKAWLGRFSGRAGSYDYGGGYKRIGPEFRSIVDVAAVNNREEYSLFGTKTFSTSSLSASGLHSRDNIKKERSLPVIRNSSVDLSYNLFVPDWPSVFLNANLTSQDSSDEPAGLDPIKNLSQTVAAGFSLVREKWNLSPSYTFTRFDDDSVADSDSRTHQAVLGLGLQPTAGLSVNPSLSWSRTDAGGSTPTTSVWQGTLAGSYLFTPAHDLFATLSAIDSDTDDNSFHTLTYDAVCQFNWRPETAFLKQARKTVSLRGRYNRTEDRIGDTAAEDYSLYLVLSIGGLPLSFL
ncbi:MAG: hypothetical protein JXB25_08980 [Deltaproteobacteria bacterium]|nr:hypothetical protein [Deltaproteobacteria bacterium]